MSTWFYESQYYFAQDLKTWPQGRLALEYNGQKMDVVQTAVKKAFSMNGTNYKSERDCSIDCAIESFCMSGINVTGIRTSGLIDDWRISSRDKRPTVTVKGQEFLAMDLNEDHADAIVRIYLKAKI